MTYIVHSIDGPGAYPNRIASGSALDAILALLERCDTVEIDELQRLHGLAIDKTCDCEDMHAKHQIALSALRAARDVANNYLVALSEPTGGELWRDLY